MISHHFPLEQAPEAFAVAADPAMAVKVILHMDEVTTNENTAPHFS